MKTNTVSGPLVALMIGAACSSDGPSPSEIGSGDGATTGGAGPSAGAGGSAGGGEPAAVGLGGVVHEPLAGSTSPTAGQEVLLEPDDVVVTGATAKERSCGVQDFDRQRKPSEVLLLLDRSSSMRGNFRSTDGVGALENSSKWEVTTQTVVRAIEATGANVWWGLKSYPELSNTDSCIPATIVPTIHSPIAESNTRDVVTKVQQTIAEGDGTPTGDAVKFGLAHLLDREAVSDNSKYLLLVTDGRPSCNGEGHASASDYAVAQITEALAAGYPTFVIGVDTKAGEVLRRMNEMAIAGGRPRATPNLPAAAGAASVAEEHLSFYLASSSKDIENALEAIRGEIASCVFDLEPPPPVPDNIAIDFSGVRTERDPQRANGWEYTSDDYTQLQVYGTWCERIKTEAKNVVNIKYGCPDIPIPLIK